MYVKERIILAEPSRELVGHIVALSKRVLSDRLMHKACRTTLGKHSSRKVVHHVGWTTYAKLNNTQKVFCHVKATHCIVVFVNVGQTILFINPLVRCRCSQGQCICDCHCVCTRARPHSKWRRCSAIVYNALRYAQSQLMMSLLTKRKTHISQPL